MILKNWKAVSKFGNAMSLKEIFLFKRKAMSERYDDSLLSKWQDCIDLN